MRTLDSDKPYTIFADEIEEGALKQFESALSMPYAVQGALMPDAHLGYSLPIGAVIATHNTIVPSWVGYDIGCGVCALPTTFNATDLRNNSQEVFANIYRDIPTGFHHNRQDSEWLLGQTYKRTDAAEEFFLKNGLKQLGSLGSGNHFIELGHDANDTVWIIIHSGSRGLGHAVATHYMRIASDLDLQTLGLPPTGKAREGHFGLTEDSKEGQDYITDLNFCLEFALQNRVEMCTRVENVLKRCMRGGGLWRNLINRNHNHAEKREFANGHDYWIHRKGATHAERDMLGVVPGNMRDGSFIVRGLGNNESLFSSSHGAGRNTSRTEAMANLSMETFTESMKGITACVTQGTLDESPEAYKGIFGVMAQQTALVEILHHVLPIINIKDNTDTTRRKRSTPKLPATTLHDDES